MFRNEVLALFPSLAGDSSPWTCLSYASLGQHGAANTSIIHYSRPARKHEYRLLARELRKIGYRLDIRQRMSPRDYENRKKALKIH